MRKIIKVTCSILLVLVFLSVISVPSTPVDVFATAVDDFVDNTILVAVYPQYNDYVYTPNDFESIGCVSIDELLSIEMDGVPSRVMSLELSIHSKQNVIDQIESLEQRDDIYFAQPDFYYDFCVFPNDTYYMDGYQWPIDKISLPQAWNTSTGSSAILVGVIDSGIDGDHPDLMNRVSTELSECFSEDYSDPLDDVLGHGTHVAGIIGAQANNNLGVSGICWSVTLVSLRVDDSKGRPTSSNVSEAIIYAEQKGIPILNFSGSMADDYAVASAIHAYSGLFVTAAGNSSCSIDETPAYPACYLFDNIITVGSSTALDEMADHSNWGSTSVDIFAPGYSVLSTTRGGGYGYMSGTSMAAPHVTGVAALMLSICPDMSIAELKTAILGHVDIEYNQYGNKIFGDSVSGGRLNAYKSLQHFSMKLCSSSNLYYHEYTCIECDYSYAEEHTWSDRGIDYYCTECGMTAVSIPGIMSIDLPNIDNIS